MAFLSGHSTSLIEGKTPYLDDWMDFGDILGLFNDQNIYYISAVQFNYLPSFSFFFSFLAKALFCLACHVGLTGLLILSMDHPLFFPSLDLEV